MKENKTGYPDEKEKFFLTASEHESEWDDFFVYNPASRHRRRIIHSLIRKYGIVFKNVLDIACGDGRMLEEMREKYGCEIHGLELGESSAPARLGKKLSGFHRLDIEQAAAPGRFELLLCTELIEHLKKDKEAALNIAGMCQTGGHIIATVPSGPIRGTDVFMGHVRHYTKENFCALLSGAGFETVECFAWGYPFHSFYRKMLDAFPRKIMREYARPRYNWKHKFLCGVLYALFFLNSHSRGGQLFYLGRKS